MSPRGEVDLGKGGGSRNGKVSGGRRGGRGGQPEQQIPPTELLERERRLRPRAGVAAILAGVLPLLGFALQQVAASAAPTDPERILSGPRAVFERAAGQADGQGLVAARQVALGQEPALLLAAAVLSALGLLLLAYVVHVLVGAFAGRRKGPVGPLGIIAPAGIALYAVGDGAVGVLGVLRQMDIAENPRADYSTVLDQTQTAIPTAAQVVLAIFAVLFVGGIVWTNLQAMAAGLFTRFVGLIGVFTGIVVLVPQLLGPSVQLDQFGILRAFWAIAVGVLLLGRWPRGEPKAWAEGVAKPWPTRAEMVEELERERAKAQRERERAGGSDDYDDDPAPRPPEGGGRRGRKR